MLSLNPVNCKNTLRAEEATTWLVTTSVKALKNSSDWATCNQGAAKAVQGSTSRGIIPRFLGETSTNAGFSSGALNQNIIRHMISSMFFLSSEKFQIFYAIVMDIPINMMDNLFICQISPQKSFHDQSMNQNVSIFICKGMTGILFLFVIDPLLIFSQKLNIVVSANISDCLTGISKFDTNFLGRETKGSKSFNFFYGRGSGNSFNSEIVHIFEDELLADTILSGKFISREAIIIIPLQLLFSDKKFSVGHRNHFSAPWVTCQEEKRRALSLLEKARKQGINILLITKLDVPVYLNEYQKGGTLKPPDRIESPAITLDIDQNTHFYFGIDSIDKYQSDINLMSQWADGATKNEKIKIDTDVLAYFVGTSPYSASLADSSNYGATAGKISAKFNIGTSGAPFQATKSNVIDLLAYAECILGEQNVPDDEDWFFVMPRIMAMLLKTSDIKDASMMGDGTSALRSGRLGRLLNFTLYASNLLPKGSGTAGADPTTGQISFYCLFGHKYGLTFASQFTETNYIDNPETTFGRFIKSLHVFGRKVIKPSAIGFAYCAPLLT